MLQVLLFSLLGILGTAIGALFGIFFGKRRIGGTLAATGGIMLGLVLFDLFPLAVRLADPILAFLAGGVGVFGVLTLCRTLPKIKPLRESNKMFAMGLLLLVSMSLHNFPEGMAIGSGSAESAGTGLLVAVAIALHDLPEGMAVAAPFVGGNRQREGVLLALFSGLSTILGALLGFFLGNLSPKANALALALASGAMLAVAFRELLPEARKNSSPAETGLFLALGILVALILIALL